MNSLNLMRNAMSRTRNWARLMELEASIHKKTWTNHDAILEWANTQVVKNSENLEEQGLIVQTGRDLRLEVLSNFRNKYCKHSVLRVLVHLPSKKVSPAGHSIFSNLIESFNYLGVACESVKSGDEFRGQLTSFLPSVFLSSDHEQYINSVDWDAIADYQKKHELYVGLTASIAEYGNTPLLQRLSWAKRQNISFYYSFRSPEYIRDRSAYNQFFSEGYNIYSVEFGANPLHYYPVGGFKKDLPYIFFGSTNSDKRQRYIDWLTPILKKYPGFIDGPGWKKINKNASINTNRYLYARAKIGINLHIDDQVDWASELNERSYILGACGVPQLIDNPKLFNMRFSEDNMFQANTPEEYFELFEHILASPQEAENKALLALKEVYKKHTTFHRSEQFILNLLRHIDMGNKIY